MWSKNELNPQVPTIHRLLVITQIASLRKSKCSSFDSCNKEKNMARIYKICIFGLEFFWTMKFVSSKIKSTFHFLKHIYLRALRNQETLSNWICFWKLSSHIQITKRWLPYSLHHTFCGWFEEYGLSITLFAFLLQQYFTYDESVLSQPLLSGTIWELRK